jgi:hypothetical protein
MVHEITHHKRYTMKAIRINPVDQKIFEGKAQGNDLNPV